MYLQFLFTDAFLEAADGDHTTYKYALYATQGLLLVFAIYLFHQHWKTLRLYGFRCDSTAMLWSMVDLVPLMANLLSIVITVTKEVQARTHTVVVGPEDEEGQWSTKSLVYF